MKMVEESKNERLKMLLGKTNELLVRLGAAVQRQKDSEHDGIEPLNTPVPELPKLNDLKTGTLWEPVPEEENETQDTELVDSDPSGDLLEGQRQYNSIIHSIEEKVK